LPVEAGGVMDDAEPLVAAADEVVEVLAD